MFIQKRVLGRVADREFVGPGICPSRRPGPTGGLVDRDNLIADNLIAAKNCKIRKRKMLNWNSVINEFRIFELESTHISSKFKFK